VLLADAGYWHQQQMENVIDRGIQVLIPLTRAAARARGRAGTAATTHSCAGSSPASAAASSTDSASR
jgi:hypothetical protein